MLSREVSAKLGFAVVSGIERAGFYRLRWTSPRVGDALVAANLTSERESDIRPRPVLFEAGAAKSSAKRVPSSDWSASSPVRFALLEERRDPFLVVLAVVDVASEPLNAFEGLGREGVCVA